MIIVPDDPGLADPLEVVNATVVKVFDGDGFLAKTWHPVRNAWIDRVSFRFAFIDAPEMQQPGGENSCAFLSQLILGKDLRLDPIGKESTGYMPIDSYKRMLCMGYLTDKMALGRVDYYRDGQIGSGIVKQSRAVTRNIELEMIVNGWAWVVERWAFEREEEYFAAQENARAHRRGIWAMENPEPPWDFKRRHSRGHRVLKTEPQARLL